MCVFCNFRGTNVRAGSSVRFVCPPVPLGKRKPASRARVCVILSIDPARPLQHQALLPAERALRLPITAPFGERARVALQRHMRGQVCGGRVPVDTAVWWRGQRREHTSSADDRGWGPPFLWPLVILTGRQDAPLFEKIFTNSTRGEDGEAVSPAPDTSYNHTSGPEASSRIRLPFADTNQPRL